MRRYINWYNSEQTSEIELSVHNVRNKGKKEAYKPINHQLTVSTKGYDYGRKRKHLGFNDRVLYEDQTYNVT